MTSDDRETFYPRERGTIVPPPMFNPHSIRELERKSIRDFVEAHKEHLTGTVLDFGCGKDGTCRKPQPYRDLVSGEYHGFEPGDRWPVGPFSAILCTQVIQYMENPKRELGWFHQWLMPGGYLILTGPTNWPEVEDSDLWRFTLSGISRLVASCGFELLDAQRRAEIDEGNEKWSLGWGVLGRRK